MNLLRLLRDWARLPSPVDLGWSETDGLGLRQFTPYQEGKTWEDWDDYVRAEYPGRYFLVERVPRWFRRWFVWPLRHFRDLVLDHVLPSRRYHRLDLRGIDSLSAYRHGYLDPSEVFWLAGWASLMRWHGENRKRRERSQAKGELEPESTHSQQYYEALDLVRYWTVVRMEREKHCDTLRAAVDAILPTLANRDSYEAAQDAWLHHFRESQDLEQKMWLRLAALRTFLWT